MDARRQRTATLGFLALAVLAGGILRFWELPQRGLVFWDEGKFALEGMRMQAGILQVVGQHTSPSAGKAVGTAKPGHALLIGLGYLVLGVHDWTSLAVDALASTLAIPVTFLIARRLVSDFVALLAAACLALSGYELLYARSALSESDACLLYLLGVLAWLPAVRDGGGTRTWKGVAGAAALFGAAFTTNYRLVIYIGAVVLVDLVVTLRARGASMAAARASLWLAGLAILPLVWEAGAIDCAHHGLILFRNEVTGGPDTYLHEAIYQIHGGKQSVVRFAPLPYLEWFWLRQGPVISLLTVVGVAAATVRRLPGPIYLIALPLIPVWVYLFAPFIVPRNLEADIPLLSVVAASGAAEIWNLGRPARVRLLVAALLVLAVTGNGLWSTTRLLAMRSGFADAASYVQLHHAGRTLTTTEIMPFYFRGSAATCNSPALPVTLGRLKADVAAGYRYALLERHRTSVSDFVRSHARRVAQFSALGPIHVGENLISSENADPPNPGEGPDEVDIYAISSLRFQPSVRATLRPSRCLRDRVV
jgi:hypothetical protein